MVETRIIDSSSSNMMLVQGPEGSVIQKPNTVKRRLQYHETYDLYNLFANEGDTEVEFGNITVTNTRHPDVFNFILETEDQTELVLQTNPITVDEVLSMLESALESGDYASLEQQLHSYQSRDSVTIVEDTDASNPNENVLRTDVISQWIESFDGISVSEKHISVEVGETLVRISYNGQIMYAGDAGLSVTPYAISPTPPALKHTAQYQTVELTELELFVLAQVTFVYDTLHFTDNYAEEFTPRGSFTDFLSAV